VSNVVNSQTFREMNQRYFAGRLPSYQVIVTSHLRHADGRIARRSRRIYLRPAPADMLLEALLHEMAHAATNDYHGPRWQAEMHRLQQLGAPVGPNPYLERVSLSRWLVLDKGYDAFYANPRLTDVQVARWLQYAYGFSSGHSLLRAYPWVRRALHDARQKAAADHQRRQRQLAAHRS
jgi:SprT-like family